MFYRINQSDIKDIKDDVEAIKNELNFLFQGHQRINQLPEQVIEISKSMGRIFRKLETISDN